MTTPSSAVVPGRADHEHSGVGVVVRSIVVFTLAFFVALWPRLTGLETFVTTDEIFWAGRSGSFARALTSGRFGETLQTGHPGVTTMWVGLLGMGAEHAQQLAGERREVSRRQVINEPAFLPGLFAARQGVAIVTSLAVAVIVLLAWRLMGPGAAVLGGGLLALDPFLVAHSQLLHIDALLASFMAVALLAGLVRWLHGGSRWFVALSGLATGLALLSKTPALFLVGFLPVVVVLAAWRWGGPARRALGVDLLLWGGLAALTYLVLWPAMWTAPLATLQAVAGFIDSNTDPDAEGLFYASAFLLRTTPLVLVGLALLILEGVLAAGRTLGARRRDTSDARASHLPSIVGVLVLFAFLFAAAMTVAAKSFDRYLLPSILTLNLLAGLGLALTARRARWLGGAGMLLAALFVLPLLALPLAISQPYALSWYNPLAGGGLAAQRVLAVGWGEGLDQVARFLNVQPGAERLKVAMPGEIYTAVLDAQFVGQVMPLEGGDPSAGGADLFVTYVRAPQDEPVAYDPRFQSWQPELSVRLGGVEYASVYDAAVGVPLGATFGSLATVEGYGLETLTTRPGRWLPVKLFWRTTALLPSETRLVLALTDAVGQEAVSAEAGIGPLEPGQVQARSYQLALPTSLAPGVYLVWVGLVDGAGQPLPLDGRPAALAPGASEHPSRAVLRSIQVR